MKKESIFAYRVSFHIKRRNISGVTIRTNEVELKTGYVTGYYTTQVTSWGRDFRGHEFNEALQKNISESLGPYWKGDFAVDNIERIL